MLRRFIDFEADLSGGGDPPAAPEPETPAADPIAAPAAPEPAGWAGPSREEWEQTQAFQQAVLEALQEPGAPEVPASPLEFNTPEDVHQHIERVANERAQALYQEQFGPYVPILDEFAKQQGEQLVTSKLGEVSSELNLGLGEQSIKQAALLAQTFFGQGVPAEKAIRAAAEMQAEHDRAIREQALAESRQQMQHRLEDGTQPAPGVRAGEEIQQAPHGTGRDRYSQLADDWANRRAAARAAATEVG